MSLKKIIQTRKGVVSMSVFRAESDGKVLLSLDKDFVSRRVKGPLFTEGELRDIAALIHDYDEWEHKAVHGTPERVGNSSAGQQAAVAAEVTRAVQEIRLQATHPHPTRKRSRIVVLPTLPKFRYLNTCSRCGCHVASYVRLPGAGTVKLCPNCETAYGGRR